MQETSTKFINQQKLPLVIEPTRPRSLEQFLGELRASREAIEKKLLTFGGLLFRGFPLENASHFHAAVEALGLGEPASYVGGDTPRNKVQGKIYTSTELAASIPIPLHNEMSFVKHYPRHIYFYCALAPKVGGETIVGDARTIYQKIDRSVKERFIERGLKYISNFYKQHWLLDQINRLQRAHKTWMEVFETESKHEVEKRCRENCFGYKWTKKDWLQVIYETPAVIAHPQTGERVWFNQAHLYDYNPRLLGFWNWLGAQVVYCQKETIMHEIYYGDDSSIARKDLYHIMDVLESQTIKFAWKEGDLMVLDNILSMHGRAPFSGDRRILVALTR